jgi:dienelactone hydrolase
VPGPARSRARIVRALLLACALAAALAARAGAGKESISVPVSTPQPAALEGELFTPRGAGPFPAVVLLHGCAGVSPNVAAWAQWLQGEGYAALVLDSFGGRGLRNLCGDPRPLTGGMRSGDVFAAVARLRTMSAIDPGRIAAMGFSHGGWTALAAWHAQAAHPDDRLRAVIALYPSCGTQLPAGGAPPLLMLVGGQDDWTPPANCLKLAEAARAAGRPVSIVLYPDARHAFDGAQIRGRVHVPAARGGKGATIEYNPRAHEDAEKQVKAFLGAELGP